jgi:hypothetical protein
MTTGDLYLLLPVLLLPGPVNLGVSCWCEKGGEGGALGLRGGANVGAQLEVACYSIGCAEAHI